MHEAEIRTDLQHSWSIVLTASGPRDQCPNPHHLDRLAALVQGHLGDGVSVEAELSRSSVATRSIQPAQSHPVRLVPVGPPAEAA